MEENKNALDEVNKGCTMGIEAINNLIDKVDSKDFKKILEKQLKQYDKIEDKINKIYSKYSEKEPHEVSKIEKTMADYMTKMKTMRIILILRLQKYYYKEQIWVLLKAKGYLIIRN